MYVYDQIVLFIFEYKHNKSCHKHGNLYKQKKLLVNRKIWSYRKIFNTNRINLFLFAQFLFLFMTRFFCLQKHVFFLWSHTWVDKWIFLFSQFWFLFMHMVSVNDQIFLWIVASHLEMVKFFCKWLQCIWKWLFFSGNGCNVSENGYFFL